MNGEGVIVMEKENVCKTVDASLDNLAKLVSLLRDTPNTDLFPTVDAVLKEKQRYLQGCMDEIRALEENASGMNYTQQRWFMHIMEDALRISKELLSSGEECKGTCDGCAKSDAGFVAEDDLCAFDGDDVNYDFSDDISDDLFADATLTGAKDVFSYLAKGKAPADAIVRAWRARDPFGGVQECCNETGLSEVCVQKYFAIQDAEWAEVVKAEQDVAESNINSGVSDDFTLTEEDMDPIESADWESADDIDIAKCASAVLSELDDIDDYDDFSDDGEE